jgi:hypothetical protein
MIKYEEALKKAKSLKRNITKCVETPTAYLFKNEDDENSIGGEGICCIVKETGRAVDLTTYYDSYARPGECSEFDVQ